MIERIYNFFYKIKIRMQFSFIKNNVSSFGSGVKLFGEIVIENPVNVSIGNNVTINSGVYISGHNKVCLSDYVSLSVGCKLITAYLSETELAAKSTRDIHLSKPVYIGKYSQIGAGAIILPGVIIGDNVVVGAGSIVTKNVQSNCIVVGNPAKILRKIEPLGKSHEC